MNFLGEIDGNDRKFRPGGAQNFSCGFRIEENIESVGEDVEAGAHDRHFGDERHDVRRESNGQRKVCERASGVDCHLAGIRADGLDEEARGVLFELPAVIVRLAALSL